MRLVLVTGKGGVGKTTLSAATAVTAADRGARTLVVSTDAAHSLGDVLDVRLGDEPTSLGPLLDAVQLDGRKELERSWGTVADYLRRLLGWSDLDRLHVDELVVVPGLDQLLALTRLRTLASTGRWDAFVVDCAPSADSLRLLSLPDVLRWYIERLFGHNGLLSGWVRRRVERTLAVPAPDDGVVASMSQLTDDLASLRALLDDATTTARIVMTPERVVVAEAQRTLAYLALYGYAVDAVLVNRVAPADDLAALPQSTQLDVIDRSFAPLPRLLVGQRAHEPIGLDELRQVGTELFARQDPLDRLSTSAALQIVTDGDVSRVRIPVLGVDRDDIQLERSGDELIVTLGAYRRTVRLPDALHGCEVVRAGLSDGHLEVEFGAAVCHVG